MNKDALRTIIREELANILEETGRVKVSGYKKTAFNRVFSNKQAYESWAESNKRLPEDNGNKVFSVNVEHE